ncbi:hypothetical protein AS156_16210 [Bradyrhizobium macuxiense]|uniref:Uncharacterized protein n=1 Tax=Bradyrhizobium macuxiense TaxID=1755647 RepID=A0A109JI55_9BRAD|nr:hypothetical protein AS156_16210 [Bradyrhizobium macuxiense]
MRRLGGLIAAYLSEGFDIGVGEPDFSAHIGERSAQAQPIGGSHSILQNCAHFRFRAAIILHRTQPQGAVSFLGEIANGDNGHNGSSPQMTASLH